MKSRNLVGLVVLIALALMFGLSVADDAVKEEKKSAEKVKHEYVGAKKCKICHKKDGVYESWMTTKHAYAFDSLSAEDQKKKELMPYYTTGVDAKGEVLANVQCEACHGPGSDYKKKSIMEDLEKAVANGLIIPDEEACFKCHNEEAPAALAAVAKDFDFEKMKAKGVHAMIEKAEAEE